MTLLEHAQRHNTCWSGLGLGISETPEIRTLPWAKGPSEKELRQQGFMSKIGTWGAVLTVVGGAVGLYVSARALGWIGARK
jgi:hypothetical protein